MAFGVGDYPMVPTGAFRDNTPPGHVVRRIASHPNITKEKGYMDWEFGLLSAAVTVAGLVICYVTRPKIDRHPDGAPARMSSKVPEDHPERRRPVAHD